METPTRGGQAGRSLASPYNIQISYGNPAARISQKTGADWFGPLDPMRPTAPPEVAGRQWDFEPGFNLVTKPRAYEPVDFKTLRTLADAFDVLRTIIETRKDQVSRMDWSIRPRDPKARKSGGPNAKLIAQVTKFFEKPDGWHRWEDWLRLILEDLFVIDAPSIFKQRDRGSNLIAMLPLDGATIKPVLDDWGRTPQPVKQGGKIIYPVAYQQILKGFPAVDYSTRDLIYRPRNIRINRAYGYSPVEQIITTVNIALRKEIFGLNYYTEGNIPDALIGVPDTWTPQQIKDYQNYWDTYIEGDLARRRRAKFVPGAMAKTFRETKEPELKSDFDEWLIRICCYAFSVPPTPFIKQMNRATAENQQQQAEEEGLAPILRWIKSLMDEVMLAEFGIDDLEFSWGEDEQVDEAKQAEILTSYSKSGVIRLNEAREKLGLDPDPNPAANMLMVQTATGMVPIEANTIDGKKEMQAAFPAPTPADHPAPGQNADGGDGESQQPPAKGKPKPKAGEEVGKSADLPFAKAHRPGPVAYPRAKTEAAVADLEAFWGKIFKRQAKAARSAVLDTLSKSPDDDRQRALEIATALDLDLTDPELTDLADILKEVAADSGQEALVQIGADDLEGMFDQINSVAAKWAKEHAAELVSEISETTREQVQRAIAEGLSSGMTAADIADSVEGIGGFSDVRSALIANTEIANANSQGALDGYKVARDTGVDVKKEWLVDDEPCPICEENASAGPIDLDASFPSGDDAPTAHPWCLCALSPVVIDSGSEKLAKRKFVCA